MELNAPTDGFITMSTPQTNALQDDPNRAKRPPEVRYYLLGDDSFQWTVKLARVEIDPNIAVVIGQYPRHLTEELLDVPVDVDRCDFLGNIYAREAQFGGGARRFGGESYGWWSISAAEHARIKRLIELTPAVTEFNRLAAYV